MKNREYNRVGFKWMLLSLLVFTISCSSPNKSTKSDASEKKVLENPELVASANELSFSSLAETTVLDIETEVKSEEIIIEIPKKDQYWLSASFIEEDKLEIRVEPNNTKDDRLTQIILRYAENEKEFTIAQNGSQFVEDSLIPVKSASAPTFESVKGDYSPKKMIDGDSKTFFCSKDEDITDWPFNLDFYFEEGQEIDYVKYTPYMDEEVESGAIGKFEIWVSTTEKPELEKLGSYDFKEKLTEASYVDFKERVNSPTHIQFRVNSALNNRVKCAQMQFYRKAEGAEDYKHIFTDKTCSELKPKVTRDTIETMSNLVFKDLALALLDTTYDKRFRVRTYRPYQHPDIMAKHNKTDSYSLRDNPTGIYVKDLDQKLVVFVGDSKTSTLSLNIKNFENNTEETFTLLTGENIITPSMQGLVYIYNHTDEYFPLNPTEAEWKKMEEMSPKIHFLTGEVNGFFDIKTDNQETWNELLENYATYSEIDVLGNHAHVVWCVDQFKEKQTDIVKMITKVDQVVDTQKEFMGIYHHNKAFSNRIFLHADHKTPSTYATNHRVSFNPNRYANLFTTLDGFNKDMWVLAQQIGHINQMNPGARWAGTAQVTNNLYALYNEQQMFGEAKRLNSSKDGYKVAFKEIIANKKPWVLPENYRNHIPKVTPFWQLKLYFVDILKQEHFYHDLFEHYRNNPDFNEEHLGNDYHGMMQLDFVRVVCNIGKINLLEFFEDWGFLRPIDCEINDYGMKTMRITQQQIDDLVKEITVNHYPKPSIRVQDLTDENYKDYIK